MWIGIVMASFRAVMLLGDGCMFCRGSVKAKACMPLLIFCPPLSGALKNIEARRLQGGGD